MEALIKNLALTLAALVTFSGAVARADGPYMKVTGADALEHQRINQYDDVNNPPQGYLVTLPKGYTLIAADVESGGSAVCGVSAYDYKKQTIRIDGFSLETDEPGCTIILSIFEKASKKTRKVTYYIEQVGT